MKNTAPTVARKFLLAVGSARGVGIETETDRLAWRAGKI